MLKQSSDMSREYCATIVKIGAVTPIEGTDNLATTEIEGRVLVVNKHQIQKGDLRVYFSNECEICSKILHELSMYDDPTLNKDPDVKGYVNKNGRVRMIKLKGQVSMGLTFPCENLVKVYPELAGFDFASNVGLDFDCVGDELIVKAYIPKTREKRAGGSGRVKVNKLAVDITPSVFRFHYDTEQLQRCMDEFKPDDEITISTKVHGTSLVISNTSVRIPMWRGLYTKFFNLIPNFLKFYRNENRVIYSSRTVIKNNKLNQKPADDIWHRAYEILKPSIFPGFTWYCEIVGYDGSVSIQKDYDYGCKPGEFKIMVYRIHYSDKNDRKNEQEFTVRNLIDDLPKFLKAENKDYIMPMQVLYEGKFSALYPYIEVDENWAVNVLNAMKADKERLGMEANEPLCKNKVPREGIVVRKSNGDMQAYKLKCLKFLGKEAELVDKGEVNFE